MQNKACLALLLILSLSFSVSTSFARENSTGHYQRAEKYALDGDLNKAIAEFKKSIEINPYYSLGHYGIGKAYLYQPGKLDDALEHLRLAVKYDRTLAKGYFYLGLACLLKKKYNHAIKAFTDAYRHDSTMIEALYNIGAVYDLLEKEYMALKYFDDYLYQKEKKEGDILF